jgi:A118 family predicted phage portal protein
MNLIDKLRGAIMKILNIKEIKSLGCDISSYMAEAVKQWDDLFYLVNQPTHSLKTAQIVTNYLATLATNELTVDAGAGVRGNYITEQAESNLIPNIWEATQLAGVGGMAAIKPYVQGESIFVEIIPRYRIYPVKFGANKRIESGFFTDFETVGKNNYVRIESFEMVPKGLHITNKAYRMKGDEIYGEPISLETVERWANLSPDMIVEGVDRPHFGIIRMPFVNNVDGSDLPVSVYANAVDSIVQLDRTWEQFLWERDTGKRRMIIDRTTAVKDPLNGKPVIPFHDLASDYYMTLDMPDEKPWADYTPSMRLEAYQKAIETQLRLLEMQTGFSAGTFQIDIKTGRVTATQVISDDRTTYNTISAVQSRGMKTGLIDVLYWFDVYASLYSLAPAGPVEFSVTFGDSIFEDTGIEFQRRKAMADSKYIRPELLTSWYFGISEDEAKEMLPDAETQNSILFGRDT